MWSFVPIKGSMKSILEAFEMTHAPEGCTLEIFHALDVGILEIFHILHLPPLSWPSNCLETNMLCTF
jgi:hypothetical protein